MISLSPFPLSDNDTDKLKINFRGHQNAIEGIENRNDLLERQKNLAKNRNPTRLILSLLTTLLPMLLLLSTVSISPFVIKSYGEKSLDIDTVQYKLTNLI
jgi:hypothetical protein